MFEALRQLVDVSDFPPRWYCGDWTQLHGWVHIVADIAIWAAYISIPLAIAIYVLRRPDTPVPRLFWLFAAFIFLCGTTHLMEAIIFWWPAYRLNAVFKVLTAVVSLATVAVLLRHLPQLLRYPSLAGLNEQLQNESQARAAVERTLIERSNLLQIALTAGQAGAWTLDLKTRQLTRYPALSRLLGLPEQVATESSAEWRERIDPADREAAAVIVDDAIDALKPFETQYRIIRADGSRIWVSARGDAYYDGNGAPAGYAGIVADITHDRVAAEHRSRLATIMESAPDAIVSLTLEGVVTAWNRGAEELYGYTAAEMIGESIQRIVPKSRESEVVQYLEAAGARHSVGPLETLRRGKDGRMLPIELVVAPIIDGKDRVIGVSKIERDISARQDNERKLRTMNRALEQRTDEMEQFLYTVSHDLKSPLVTILGFAGVAGDELGDHASPDVVDALDRIERAATRMTGLIDDLLEVSRVGRTPHRPSRVDVAALIAEACSDFTEAFGEQEVRCEIAGALPPIYGDPVRIRQIVDNLISNALKYGCPVRPGRIEIGGAQSDGETLIYVRDFGPGIPSEHREKVFQLFQRLDQSADGTGLGLALVRRIMQAHHGRVWIDETPSGGVTVWLAFPHESEGEGERRPAD